MADRRTEEQFRKENAALGRLLKKALKQTGWTPPPGPDGRPLQILDLACGSCREAETLVEAARSLPAGPTRQGNAEQAREVRFVGADIRDREIEEAAARAQAAGIVAADFEFLHEDCSRLDRNSQLGDGFDLAFLRHQNYWNDREIWHRIFEQGLARLNDDGLLVITSYFDREHDLACEALERVGAERLVTLENEQSRLISAKYGKSVDKHLAVFRRKQKS